MATCKRCGSQAINHHLHGRDGTDGDLCDVCYWRTRAEFRQEVLDARYPPKPVGTGKAAAVIEAVAQADAYLSNVGLPVYSAIHDVLFARGESWDNEQLFDAYREY